MLSSRSISLLRNYLQKNLLARVIGPVGGFHLLLLFFPLLTQPPPVKKTTSLCIKSVKLHPAKIADIDTSPKAQREVKATEKPQTSKQHPKQLPQHILEEAAEKTKSTVEKKESHKKSKEAPVQEKSEPKSKEKLLDPKSKTKKPPDPKKPASTPKNPSKVSETRSKSPDKPTVDTQLLKQAMASLGQINTSKSSQLSNSSKPSLSGSELGRGQGTITHEQAIAQFLRVWLRLPEYGQVTIALKLNASGEVVDLKMLSWESDINCAFVKERLPKLIFPIVENQRQEQAERTLTLVLSNE